MKKWICIVLSAIFLLGTSSSCMFFDSFASPCAVETWYIESYRKDGVSFSAGTDAIDPEKSFYPTDITLSFFEGGSFLFKEFEEERPGTSSCEGGKVKLTFSDGGTGKGNCFMHTVDDVWYTAEFTVSDTKYVFGDYRKGREVRADYPTVEETYARQGKEIGDVIFNNYAYSYILGETRLKNGDYIFIPASIKYEPINISRGYEKVFYRMGQDFFPIRTDEPAEGKCAMISGQNIRQKGEESETLDRYAVWYLDDLYAEKLFPWISDLSVENVESFSDFWPPLEAGGGCNFYVSTNKAVILKRLLFIKNLAVMEDAELSEKQNLSVANSRVVVFTAGGKDYSIAWTDFYDEDGAYYDGYFTVDGKYYRANGFPDDFAKCYDYVRTENQK